MLKSLCDFANGYNYDGSKSENKIAKALAATSGWKSSDKEGSIGNDMSSNNISGFTALAGGCQPDILYRDQYSASEFTSGYMGYWWSSTESGNTSAWARELNFYYEYLQRHDLDKTYGNSIRCVKD